MGLGTVQLYYSEKKGFIISALARVKGPGFLTDLNPVMVADKDISNERVGELVRENLERSRNSGLVEREDWKKYNFWHVSGIKSFSAFSKKFLCIDITEKETALEITRLYRDTSGAYSYSGNTDFELPLDISDVDLGNRIRELLQTRDDGAASINEFDSIPLFYIFIERNHIVRFCLILPIRKLVFTNSDICCNFRIRCWSSVLLFYILHRCINLALALPNCARNPVHLANLVKNCPTYTQAGIGFKLYLFACIKFVNGINKPKYAVAY